MDDLYCADVSQQVNEPLYGTAVSIVNVWFLLEYSRPWRAKATEDNELPEAVQHGYKQKVGLSTAVFNSFAKQNPIQTLHALSHFPPQGVSIVFLSNNTKTYYKIDIASLLAEDNAFDSYLWTEPLYLVCTNGKRDRCCARQGANFFRTLQPLAGASVWQTTHLGGHRFAPTLLTLRRSHVWSFTPNDAPTLLQAPPSPPHFIRPLPRPSPSRQGSSGRRIIFCAAIQGNKN